MPSRGTPATNVRLTESQKAMLEVIRQHYGLPSVADAIRKSIETQRLVMEAETDVIGRVARGRKK